MDTGEADDLFVFHQLGYIVLVAQVLVPDVVNWYPLLLQYIVGYFLSSFISSLARMLRRNWQPSFGSNLTLWLVVPSSAPAAALCHLKHQLLNIQLHNMRINLLCVSI